MLQALASLLTGQWGISESLLRLALEIENTSRNRLLAYQSITDFNALKVLKAFREVGVSEAHLQASHGYGYFDLGRESLDRVFAEIFGAEDALVRPQLISGTQAIRVALFGALRPGDELLVVPALPYDTLLPVFGLKEASGSLKEWGVSIRGIEAREILEDRMNLTDRSKVMFIQRSKGYRWQPSISISELSALIAKIKSCSPKVWVVVDNCYGEFVEEKEPTEVGADLVVGSLLKNPGGGLSPTGGYLAGKAELIHRAAAALNAPGLGKDVGPTLSLGRSFFTGLFLAPQFVGEALKTVHFAAELFDRLGYRVLPEPGDHRTDIIQAIALGTREAVLAFARGIQKAGPLDRSAIPLGAAMAGYADEIVMSGGTFTQGGSLELSCDAPLRPPFAVYVQGGLFALHGKLGILLAATEVEQARKQG